AELNGKVGRVGSFYPESGRYVVVLDTFGPGIEDKSDRPASSWNGKRVTVWGLQSSPQHNHRSGICGALVEATGRYPVRLEGKNGLPEQVVSLKPDNLKDMSGNVKEMGPQIRASPGAHPQEFGTRTPKIMTTYITPVGKEQKVGMATSRLDQAQGGVGTFATPDPASDRLRAFREHFHG
ncbi:hypothetical protein T484DRAFT_1791795, partial [Baffinella frigidus]